MKVNEVWKYLATSAMSCLVTGAVAWFAFGAGAESKLATLDQVTRHNTATIQAVAEATRLNAETLSKVNQLLARHDERIKYLEQSQ